jgi:8-oxo-dGTP pyrophosphatase MutT (NUDIX family)
MPHIHEKIDFVAEVFIIYKNKVLLRKHDKYGIWLSIGGHVELDEDPVQAAIREVREEVGLNIELVGNPKPNIAKDEGYQELLPPKYLNRHNVKPGHEHVCFVYFGKAHSDVVKPEKETDVFAWFTEEELKTNKELNLRENVLFYATEALRELRDL